MNYILVIIFLMFSILPAYGDSSFQDDKHRINLISGYDSTGTLGAVQMGLHYKFAGDWKTYWRYPGFVGYPIKIDFSGSTNVKGVTVTWPLPEQFTTFSLKSYGYAKEVVLPLTIDVINPGVKTDIKLKLDYLVCDPAHCLRRQITLDSSLTPHDVSGNLKVQPSQNFALIKSYMDKVPHPDNGSGMTVERVDLDASLPDHSVLTIYARNPKGFKAPLLFIEPHANMYVDFAVEQISQDKETAVFVANVYLNELRKEQPRTSLINKKITITLKDGDEAIEAVRIVDAYESAVTQVLLVLLFAFVGGVILNFMPCVLPVIFIKVLSIFQQGGVDKHQVRRNFLLTVIGILSSFWFLAVLSIAFKDLGYAVGWGAQFQEPTFLVAIMLILLLFAINLLGWFEFTLPSRFATGLTEIETRESAASYFFSGAFVTLLATPCTAPFLGTAISYALSRGSLEIMAIFSVMGLGLALPFLIIGLFPRFVHKLPKPGKWMVTLKKALSIPLFLTLIWLLWTYSLIEGPAATYVLTGVLTLTGGIFFLKYKELIYSRVSWSSVLGLTLLALLTPQFYAQQSVDRDLSGSSWEKFDEKKIDAYVKEGKTVFVDVTAEWCLTCKANEAFVLRNKEVLERFAAKSSKEMVADWTNGDEKVTVFMRRYGKYGVPFYVVFGPKFPDGKPLPEVLTPQIVEDSLKDAL